MGQVMPPNVDITAGHKITPKKHHKIQEQFELHRIQQFWNY